MKVKNIISMAAQLGTLRNDDMLEQMELWSDIQSQLEVAGNEAWDKLEKTVIEKKNEISSYGWIFLCTALLEHYRKPYWLERILEEVLACGVLSYEEKQFIYAQLSNWVFTDKEIHSWKATVMLHELWKQVLSEYKDKVGIEAGWIPLHERNKEFVIVMAGQILSLEHGPTKTTLARCKILMEEWGKDVLLINTGQVCSQVGRIPFYRIKNGNQRDDLDSTEVILYNGCKIPFVQFCHEMPDAVAIGQLMQLVMENKPYMIISIGGPRIAEELCAELTDVLVVSLCPSSLVDTKCSYQQIGRPLEKNDEAYLTLCNIDKEKVISGVFTSDLKGECAFVSKSELGIGQQKKIGVIIGGRLDEEIKDDFLEMLDSLRCEGVHYIVLGVFEKGYARCKEKYPLLAESITYCGMVSNVRAYMECADFYINPTRRGGGTSVVEAMVHGVPAVTTKFGDVYVNAGEDFAVEDYAQMRERILQYIQDEEFWKEHSEKSIMRAKKMLDTKNAFVDILQEFERRIQK